ncbi:MAG: DJ-1/PfpI family protein [Oscillospiraceae bacterium]|nr:DJ-1/PfpI family protein [Oscillospiraceae bacterium]
MVYVLLGQGFEEVEALAPVDILRRGGVEVQTAGIGGKWITGGHGITVQADITVEEMDDNALEMIVLPGGLGGVKSIEDSRTAMEKIQIAFAEEKFVCAICAAPTVLEKLGITAGKTVTCYPDMKEQMLSAHATDAPVTQDGNVICGQAAGSAMEFGFTLLTALKGEETANAVRKAMVFAS